MRIRRVRVQCRGGAFGGVLRGGRGRLIGVLGVSVVFLWEAGVVGDLGCGGVPGYVLARTFTTSFARWLGVVR